MNIYNLLWDFRLDTVYNQSETIPASMFSLYVKWFR